MKPLESKKPRRTWLEILDEHVKGMRFGVIQIVIHEGQVVQIDRTEKVRLDPKSSTFADANHDIETMRSSIHKL